jgi:hypothetical protein
VKAWLAELFNPKGTVSSTRVMAVLCVLAACGLGWYGILQNRDLSELSILCGTFLAAAFTGKVAQKHAEAKS